MGKTVYEAKERCIVSHREKQIKDEKGVMSWREEPGIPGPSGITDFETGETGWSKKHVQLQNLCFSIIKFMQENPEIASTITITRDSIKSSIR